MLGKQNRQSPTVLGTMLQAATYGMTMPRSYGLTKSPLIAIWAQNLRQGSSSKKSKKKGVQTYVEQIDFTLGSNPILAAMQFWYNTTKLPLTFTSQSFSINTDTSVVVTDANFYAVVAVTLVASYSQTFNDYGNPNGSQSVSGSFEIPLWNNAYAGPDPTDGMGNRFFPYVYFWVPGNGTTVLLPSNSGGLTGGNLTGTLKVYYAAKAASIGHRTPASVLRLTFESQLGNNNSAYAGYSSQQIVYPPYAGVSSPNYDLGASASLPNTQPEILSAYTLYSTGDADFADMAEDIVKSGQQVLAAGLSPTQSGLNLSDLPGCIQKKFYYGGIEFYYNAPAFDFPNTLNNYLLVQFWTTTASPITGISDTAGNTWTLLYNQHLRTGTDTYAAAWICQHNGYAGLNTVTVAWGGGYQPNQAMYEIGGCDTLDQNTVLTGTTGPITGSITTAGLPGLPSYVIYLAAASNQAIVSGDPRWNQLGPGAYPFNIQAYAAPVSDFPGTYPFSIPTSGKWALAMLSFKNSQPVNYPKPLGNIMEPTTLANAKLGARAGGLWGALSMNQQKSAGDWLGNIYDSGNMAPVWDGFLLRSIARSEASAAANGAIYIAPTASGPVVDLSDVFGDFVGAANTPPITIKRSPQVELPPVLQYQILNRNSDYNSVTVAEPDAGSVSLYGVRKEQQETRTEISDVSVARNLLGIMVRRRSLLRKTYVFKLMPRWMALLPMDLVTLTEPLLGLSKVPVRLTKIVEEEDGNLSCEAEDFIYGLHAPGGLASTPVTNNAPNLLADPGAINTPIIFEAVPRLTGAPTQPYLVIVVSAASVIYGGCFVQVSTDGGSSYNTIGQINGNGITGYTTSDWPIHIDPDTTNDLPVDLTESLGTLSSYLAADRDAFTYPCYVAAGNANIPYGLMTYNTATLTAANKYTLKATGGGNELRRCVFGAPAVGTDTDHPNNSRWAFLGPAGLSAYQGVFKVQMDPKWIGTTLYFKFLPINTFGNTGTLSSAYSFTPTGIPGSQKTAGPNSYTQSPLVSLTQPSGTSIAMAQTTTQFGGNAVNYNARTFTITNPGSPTVYYVTIADPGMIGDTGAGTNLTATCQTSNALVGVPGNTFIGFIIAVPGGGAGATGAPGGWPQPVTAVIAS